ncbi:MAG: hypothetical protein ACYC6N_11715 [Pirellulaceae bacterium]
MTRFLLATVVMFATIRIACAADGPPRVAPEDFAILAWSWVSDDADTLRQIHECGFNLAGFVAPKSLDAVAAAGLKAIVSEGATHVGDDKADRTAQQVLEEIRPLVEQTVAHPATFGYYLRDEPNARMFPALARYAAAYRQTAPQTRPYINLFPNYASAQQLGTETYQEHLEQYITTVQPPFVSYDHYALMEDGSLRGGYFTNLEAVRSAALAHNLPFWNIVLSNAHFTYAEPSPAGLRFQAYTTLAYGGRGISYFTYVSPNSGNYRLAPIDQFGNKTPTWEMLRNVNLQIHALAPTMITLKSVGVFHHPDVPEGCRALADSPYVAEITGSGRFVVGEFTGPDETPFVMVVNKDLHESTSFGVRFKPAGKIFQTNSYTGETSEWRGENNWLAAGQGMLLSLGK